MPPAASTAARKLILGLAVAWAALALLRETAGTLAGLDIRAKIHPTPESIARWRLGTPPVARLDRCLDLVRQHVPPGRVVAFASPADTPGKKDGEFYRWRWAAYLLPEYDVAPLQGPDTGRLAQYLITWERTVANPRLEPLAAQPGCQLYRVREAGR
jgi:hypothetical protein